MDQKHINPYTGLEEQMSSQEKLLYSLLVSLTINVALILYIALRF